MKIALCLHGLVGSTKGKNGDLLGGSDEVLEHSFRHNQENILGLNVDVFIHSWSTELKEDILEKYNPKRYIIEPQIQFKVPDYIKSDQHRAFAHLSRWYSYRESVKLKAEYELQTGEVYDYILVQRFDLCWNIKPDFANLDSNLFYVGHAGLDNKREWSDRWFISNSTSADKFATMYDKLAEYMGPGGEFPSSKQYAGISSHFLTKFHAKKLGLKEEFIYNFGGYGSKPDDYNEVRRMCYGDK